MISNKDAFKLAKKNNKKRRVRHIILTSVITIMLFMIMLPFSYHKSSSNKLNNLLKNEYQTKGIAILQPNEEELERVKKFVRETDYVVKFLEQDVPYYEMNILNLPKMPTNVLLTAKSAIPYNSPDNEVIIDGRNLKNENEIICPKRMFFAPPSENAGGINNSFDMKDYIGTTLQVRFRKHKAEGFVKDYIEREYKLVGTFNSEITRGFQTCYIKESEFDKMIPEIIEVWNESWGSNIYLKSYFDIEKANEALSGISRATFVHDEYIFFNRKMLTIITIEAIIIMIINIIIFIIYLKNYIKENYKTMTLYKALGFTKKDTQKVILFQILQSFILALAIVLIVTFIGAIALRIYYYYSAQAYITNIVKIDLIATTIFLVILFTIIFYLIKSHTKIIDKFTVKELTKE